MRTFTVDATLLGIIPRARRRDDDAGQHQRAVLERDVERRRAAGSDRDRTAVGLAANPARRDHVAAGRQIAQRVGAALIGDRHALRREDGHARAHDRGVRLRVCDGATNVAAANLSTRARGSKHASRVS